MSLNNNVVAMHINERMQAFRTFKELHQHLDELIKALYQSSLYTCAEYDRIARRYHILQHKADLLEEKIRQDYPAFDLNERLKWLKSNPKDEEEDEKLYDLDNKWTYQEKEWVNMEEDWNNTENKWNNMEEKELSGEDEERLVNGEVA